MRNSTNIAPSGRAVLRRIADCVAIPPPRRARFVHHFPTSFRFEPTAMTLALCPRRPGCFHRGPFVMPAALQPARHRSWRRTDALNRAISRSSYTAPTRKAEAGVRRIRSARPHVLTICWGSLYNRPPCSSESGLSSCATWRPGVTRHEVTARSATRSAISAREPSRETTERGRRRAQTVAVRSLSGHARNHESHRGISASRSRAARSRSQSARSASVMEPPAIRRTLSVG